MRYTYQHDGQTHTLELIASDDGHYRVTLGEREIPVVIQPLADGGWRLYANGQWHRIYAAAQADKRFVQVDGVAYTLTVPPSGTARRRTSAAGDELVAQMPGQVTAVMVQSGDHVARGQTLLILEAMKMEIRVTAPSDGQLQGLLVQQGEVVERGQRLVAFEAAS